jgi:SAM-dependent methyltransferase
MNLHSVRPRTIQKALGKRMARLIHRGSDRHCPLCGANWRRFGSYGVVRRDDARCHECSSLERHRMIWLYFIKAVSGVAIRPGTAFLHFAPEPSLERHLRRAIGTGYVTADLYAARVDFKMDVTDIRFPAASFDLIYCSHVLEHVPDDRKALAEFRRVLRPDGLAVIMVPITAPQTVEDASIEDPQERLRLFGQDDHVRRYGPDFVERLEDAGFRVRVVAPEQFLPAGDIERYGITAAAGHIFECHTA